MPKQELTPEQKQVKRILKRWKQSLYPLLLFCSVTNLIFMIIKPPWDPSPGVLLLLTSVVLGIFALTIYRTFKANKQLVKDFTTEERHALEAVAAGQNLSQQWLAREAARLLRLHQTVMFKPEKELLRASKPTDDGTLLRSATENNELPKEELLRAAQSDNQ